MRRKADISTAAPRQQQRQRRRFGVTDAAPYVLTVASVVLAWHIVLQPALQRAPAEAVVRLAPNSPLVLRRAAESELSAERTDNAAVLAREALVRSPFDVRALRVVGLSDAQAGHEDQADDILTLAGNWSLRDDPTHAWLVEHRLKRGDYVSAFAHADTLVRRRQDIQPEVFRLFTVAGVEDPERSLPALVGLLSSTPPWRAAYLNSLSATPQDLQLAARLAIMLQAGPAPLSNGELRGLYNRLLRQRQFEALKTVRTQLNRPGRGAVTNGGFDDKEAPEPFQWRFVQKAGVVVEITADDVRSENLALRVDYDGYASARIAEQLTFLSPGSYRFAFKARNEAGDPAARLTWTLTCASDGLTIASMPAGRDGAGQTGWGEGESLFEAPANCSAQWLRLETRAADRRSPTVVWFDQISITPVG